MKIVAILMFVLLLPSTRAGWSDNDVLGPPLTIADWKKFESAFQEFDEIRLFRAIKEVSVPKVKDGKLVFEPELHTNIFLHAVTGIADSKDFHALLLFDPEEKAVGHGCLGLFNVFFYRKGEQVARLHYAHGKYFAPLTKASQEKINSWLVERGFPIEKLMANDKKRANQMPEPTGASAPVAHR